MSGPSTPAAPPRAAAPGAPVRRAVRSASVRVALILACASAGAGVVAAPIDTDPAPHDVRGWLMRIHDAAGRRNFRGTFVATAGGTTSSARIAHYVEGPNQYERSETLDGEMRRVYRHNETVLTAWPSSHVVTVERRDPIAQFPALLQSGDAGIGDRYRLEPQGSERVAGRDAEVVLVLPRDALRYGYRLWADRASGLLLRLDTLGEQREVLESSAFSDLEVDIRAEPQTVLQPMHRLAAGPAARAPTLPTSLEAEGWTLRQPVPGFRQASCFRRSMPAGAGDAGTAAAGPRVPVVQAIFSDGLTYVSVFIEPVDPAHPKTPISTLVGATRTLMEPHGDAWMTLVGDVPPATLRLFARALERRR